MPVYLKFEPGVELILCTQNAGSMEIAQPKCQERSAAVVSAEEWLCSREGEQSGRARRDSRSSPGRARCSGGLWRARAGSRAQSVTPPRHPATPRERAVSVCCRAESEGSGSAARSSARIKIHSAPGGPGLQTAASNWQQQRSINASADAEEKSLCA